MLEHLDKRQYAYRERIADKRLYDQASAEQQKTWQFLDSAIYQVNTPCLGLHSQNDPTSPLDNQLLFGERVRVFSDQTNKDTPLAWVQMERDGYVGYANRDGLRPVTHPSTHQISVPLAPCFKSADIKSGCLHSLPLNASAIVTEQQGRFSKLYREGWVISKHLVCVHKAKIPDRHLLIALAKGFVDTPYVWGGNSRLGLDCSGLIQILFAAIGVPLPRDTDQQQAVGKEVTRNQLEAGDLIFWKSHVGMMMNETHLLHANAHHMRTIIEPLKLTEQRIQEKFQQETSAIKRILPDTSS